MVLIKNFNSVRVRFYNIDMNIQEMCSVIL